MEVTGAAWVRSAIFAGGHRGFVSSSSRLNVFEFPAKSPSSEAGEGEGTGNAGDQRQEGNAVPLEKVADDDDLDTEQRSTPAGLLEGGLEMLLVEAEPCTTPDRQGGRGELRELADRHGPYEEEDQLKSGYDHRADLVVTGRGCRRAG